MLSALRKKIDRNLSERGLSLRPADLAAYVEGVAPKSTRVALSYALDLLRPFSAGMGFKVARLSDRQIEMIVPKRTRNLDEAGRIHEAALFTAALEASRLLWLRHAPIGNFHVHLVNSSFRILQEYKGEVRLRMELPEMQVENVLAKLRQRSVAETEVVLHFFDKAEKSVAEATLTLRLSHTPSLSAP